MSGKKWFPLESNPEVMNKYIQALGVESTQLQFCDVFGVDPDLLGMVPQPCKAVLFLFPISENNEKWKQKTVSDITASGQTLSKDVFFVNQTIGNACGTIGILHALANNLEDLKLKEGSFLKNFIDSTKDMSPKERAQFLADDTTIEEAQGTAAQEGQTQNQPLSAQINLHFIAYVEKEGNCYELDGTRPFPINVGKSSPETLLQDASGHIKKYMELDPDEVKFTLVSLSKV
eukprot:TRINITY_DN5298_c0_g1_i2.p1 TRINITY_DN5298_c0_g1~~TRINITY_DN5298_c0_g1_i2.p1  ORF type:complete len:248 (+),score=61.50 TRINITY_DN5298_c0_g1_i2:49-744(+)